MVGGVVVEVEVVEAEAGACHDYWITSDFKPQSEKDLISYHFSRDKM